MATIVLDLNGTLPQTFTEGNWPRTHLNTLKWRFTWTPAAANTNAAWANDFYALFASSGTPNGSDAGGLWIVNDALELYNQTTSVFSRPLTWGAGAAITITIDIPNGQVTISGATTGNGTFSFTHSGTYFTAGTFGVGVYGGGGFNLPSSTISDVDDANDGPVGGESSGGGRQRYVPLLGCLPGQDLPAVQAAEVVPLPFRVWPDVVVPEELQEIQIPELPVRLGAFLDSFAGPDLLH